VRYPKLLPKIEIAPTARWPRRRRTNLSSGYAGALTCINFVATRHAASMGKGW